MGETTPKWKTLVMVVLREKVVKRFATTVLDVHTMLGIELLPN
jgi:hypothetical protein